MKINLTLLSAALLGLTFFPCAQAQVTVVKQEGSSVYLDTSDFNRVINIGDSFKIIISQEDLVNPKTGKNLGRINHYSPIGKIKEVQPLYVIGEMPDGTAYAIGQEAVIEPATSTVQTALAAQPADKETTVSARKIKTYDILDREIISAVQADLTAHPGEEIAAIDTKNNLIIYATDGTALQEITQLKLPVGQKAITLSVKDVIEKGTPQLFLSVYKENEQRISTLVFEVQEQEIKQIALLPYLVKELGCGKDKEIYAQKSFVNGSRPGNAYKLEYKNNRFKTDKDSFATRGNWLTGSNYYEIQNKDTENFIYTTPNGRLRMRLANGKFTDSPALFATAPNRVKYKQEIISFYPALQVYGPEAKATLAGIENTAKFGLLSEQFGQYNGGKIHFLTYKNGVLAVEETLPLGGFVYDSSCTQRGILVPQIVSGGQTVLAEIYR